MKKTKLTLKSFFDGLSSYWVWYILTSLLLWSGFILFKLIHISYFQCLGLVIIIRQMVGLVKYKNTKPIPDEQLKEISEEEINCRKNKDTKREHNKGIFSLRQCPICYSNKIL